MDSSHILKPVAIVNNSFLSKTKRFFVALILADLGLGNAVNVFIQKLNNKGLLGLGEDFQALFMIWGNSIWPNILHIFILAFTAGIFGFTFGYLSRKVDWSDKLIFTTLYVFIRFIFLGLFSIIIDIFFPYYSSNWDQLVTESIYSITSSTFNATFIILGYIAMFVSAIYFMKLGSKVINNPYYQMDKGKSETLLEIKWYHYFWLFIPIAIYGQVMLNLVYHIGYTLVSLVKNFKWSTIPGDDDGNKGNTIDDAWSSLIAILIIASLIIFLMDYLRKVLIGETSHHWILKTLIAIGIAFGIPFLLIWYTSLAG